MKKLQSSFLNMVLVLGLVSILAAALLAYMHELTTEPIRQANLAKQESAIREVSPAFDNSPVAEKYEILDQDGNKLNCYPTRKNGTLVATAVETYSNKGFNGNIRVMIGFMPDGSIYNYSVLKQSETPGLGTKMVNWFKTEKNKQSILGKNPSTDNISVSKDGGDIDAITAATISSRAFMDAVNRAYQAYIKEGGKQ